MTNLKSSARLASVVAFLICLLVLASPAFATTCSADASPLQGGGQVLLVSTDARGAVAAIVLDASGRALQRLPLGKSGSATAIAAFPTAPGDHFEVVFVNRKGASLCVDGIDISDLPDPSGGLQ